MVERNFQVAKSDRFCKDCKWSTWPKNTKKMTEKELKTIRCYHPNAVYKKESSSHVLFLLNGQKYVKIIHFSCYNMRLSVSTKKCGVAGRFWEPKESWWKKMIETLRLRLSTARAKLANG